MIFRDLKQPSAIRLMVARFRDAAIELEAKK